MQADSSTDSEEPFEENSYKIGIVGEHVVGKTAIAQRFTVDTFSPR